jgi:hypothetical protein
MNTINDLQRIEQLSINNQECLKFNFSGILSQKDASQICNEWKSIAEASKEKKYVIIFNALEMTDYDPLTRTSFQNTMKELKNQIDKVWVISESRLIRGGAAIMSMLTSFPIRAVNSEDQVVV